MNWMKLRSSILAISTVLLINCPEISTAGILCYSKNTKTNTSIHQSIPNQITSDYKLLQADEIKRSGDEIMKIVLQQIPGHNPSSLNSYSEIKYNRFSIKSHLMPSSEIAKTDTSGTAINHSSDNFLFSGEILSYQKLLKPEFQQSETISARYEGKDEGSYAKLAGSLGDISLLKPLTEIFNRSFLSPFSKEGSQKYLFNSADSVTTSGDTLYKVTFIPRGVNHFDGFTGNILINSKDSAILQITAQTTQCDEKELLLDVFQRFEQIQGFCLPSEKKVKFYFNEKSGDNIVNSLIAECNVNTYQQLINPPLSPEDFKDSKSQPSSDSPVISENEKQQQQIIRLMAEGKVSLGYFNLDYNRIFGYNLYEGIKLGFGGETNERLSHYFKVGGFVSYGLKDKSLHHGESIDIFPSGKSDLRVHFSYKDMNLEFGNSEFPGTRSLLNPESYYTLLTRNMFATKRYTAGLEFQPFHGMNLYLFGDISENWSRKNTQFLSDHPFDPVSLTRTGLQIRYFPGVNHKMTDERLNETTVPKGEYYVTIVHGLTIFNGEYGFTKVEFKGKFDLPFSKIGTTTVMVRGGAMTLNEPIIELFNGYGSFAGTFSLAAPYSFATMRLNEFGAADYTAIHIRHNFSPWLFSEKTKTRPSLIFAQNFGIGLLKDQQIALYNLTDYRKGFFESGFEINNLLRMNYLSFGLGIYYRYGPYRLNQISDNFAYKFGFFFKL
jgi:hypothetical protein